MDGFNQYYSLPKKRITDLDGFSDITIPSAIEKEKNNLAAWNFAMNKGTKKWCLCSNCEIVCRVCGKPSPSVESMRRVTS